MRKCLALFSALALFALPFLFAYVGSERLLEWPEAMHGLFDPWLPLVIILWSSVITLTLPWISGLFSSDSDR